jgi:hypothetical protein
VHLPRRGRVAQRLPPGLANQKIPVPAQTVSDPQPVQRLGVVRIGLQKRLSQTDGFLHFVEKPFLDLGCRVDLGTPQKRVVARDQLALERPYFEHLAKLDALRHVIVKADGVWLGRQGLFQFGDRLIVLQVIEVIEG